MHQKRITAVYYREMAVAFAVYAVLLVGSIKLGRPMEPGVPRTIALLSPMLGFGLMIWAIARHFGRIDEYLRRMLLEALALAAAITAGLTFSYGFLETAGYPRLSMFTVWGVMAGAWGLIAAIQGRRSCR
jgi:hypothetical protein